MVIIDQGNLLEVIGFGITIILITFPNKTIFRSLQTRSTVDV